MEPPSIVPPVPAGEAHKPSLASEKADPYASGIALLHRYGLTTRSKVFEIAAVLGSALLRVASEDEVLSAVLAIAATSPARAREAGVLWPTLRLSWLSPEAFALVPPDAPRATEAMRARAYRAAHPLSGSAKLGAWPLLASEYLAGEPPRESYAFTATAQGSCAAGAGASIYFIWVNPADPLGNTDAAAGLPAPYALRIARWAATHGGGAAVSVLNGAQCAAAVRQCAAYPEFAVHGVFRLWDVYQALAKRGDWIFCVDIARLAVLWLCGGGSVYLDTDMDVGTHALPRELTAAPQRAPDGLPPLLVLAQDADGLLQNNFLAVTAPAHPFLTLALQVGVAWCAAGSGAELGPQRRWDKSPTPCLPACRP